jgi:hypothetical protein
MNYFAYDELEGLPMRIEYEATIDFISGVRAKVLVTSDLSARDLKNVLETNGRVVMLGVRHNQSQDSGLTTDGPGKPGGIRRSE